MTTRGILQRSPPGVSWWDAVRVIGNRLASRFSGSGALPPERVANALYRGILEREPDLPGLVSKAEALRRGETLEQVIRYLIGSPEFRSRFLESIVQTGSLPDLAAAMPDHYAIQPANGGPIRVYLAETNGDMMRMSSLIERYRFYDRFGVWSPE